MADSWLRKLLEIREAIVNCPFIRGARKRLAIQFSNRHQKRPVGCKVASKFSRTAPTAQRSVGWFGLFIPSEKLAA
jgi:hypothetical protein